MKTSFLPLVYFLELRQAERWQLFKRNFPVSMKFELRRPIDYSDDAFLKEIRRVSKLVPEKPLTKNWFNQNSKYSASTIDKRFGGWLASLKKAGLQKSYLHSENQKISTEEILHELKHVSKILKSTSFSRLEFAATSKMNPYVFKGPNSFNRMMKSAGLNVPLKSRRYTDQECFENLLNVWTFYQRQPSYAEIKMPPSIIGAKAYINRWGSWTKALIAFLNKVDSDLTTACPDKEPIQNINTAKKKILTPEERREIPLGLRYDILKRDKFACVICGRTPKVHNISLQIDHIIAWTKGGKTVKENLRTLCNECNNGKSNKDE